jgi:hypothetical protein
MLARRPKASPWAKRRCSLPAKVHLRSHSLRGREKHRPGPSRTFIRIRVKRSLHKTWEKPPRPGSHPSPKSGAVSETNSAGDWNRALRECSPHLVLKRTPGKGWWSTSRCRFRTDSFTRRNVVQQRALFLLLPPQNRGARYAKPLSVNQ